MISRVHCAIPLGCGNEMENPFDRMTSICIDRPRTVLAIGLVCTLALSSMAMFLEFDNSEDAFFPDNDTVRLLDEVEEEYQASLDFVRIIVRIDSGGLSDVQNWVHLAEMEAILLEDQNFTEYGYPLFGTRANSGPASIAMGWELHSDPITAQVWSEPIENALIELESASEGDEREIALDNLEGAMFSIPSPVEIDSSALRSWVPSSPDLWVDRLANGENITQLIVTFSESISAIQSDDESFNVSRDLALVKLGILSGMQYLDYSAALKGTVPAADHEELIGTTGPVLISFVITTESERHGGAPPGDIQEDVDNWAGALQLRIEETGDSASTVFSFSQFSLGQNENLGKELGILNSASLLILGTILWFSFRSKRDTGYVLGLTVFGIGATYGTAGTLTLMGVPMTFNGAMNSIPVLLLAIGVDYGLHVVKRIREEYRLASISEEHVASVGDLQKDLRKAAVLRGTKYTSIALLIAIFTDMVGFLSFRLSSQSFLVIFGTVIAIGLFYIYLFSVTALPALISLIPPKDLPIERTVKIEENRITRWVGDLTKMPATVVLIAVLLSMPALYGVQQLEVGFDTRDNFDDSVPVVADFLLISDVFQSSPSPLYVVLDGPVISEEGRIIAESAIRVLQGDDRVTQVTTDLWSTLESGRFSNPLLDLHMSGIESGADDSWGALEYWLLQTDEGRELSAGILSSSGDQTVISFQASTLDWSATSEFESQLSSSLASEVEGSEFTLRVSGRSLILAQITSDVADAATLSTTIVAGVILIMLFAIQTGRTGSALKGVKRGFVTWLPLMAVVAWVFGIMGFTGFQLNSQTVTIGALTLGLGVDYAVHIATRIEEEAMHDPSAGPSVWTSRSIATTGRAMCAAALTTAGGFSVLNLSSLVPLQLFGQAFVVAITLALMSSLLLLPPLYARLLESEIRHG